MGCKYFLEWIILLCRQESTYITEAANAFFSKSSHGNAISIQFLFKVFSNLGHLYLRGRYENGLHDSMFPQHSLLCCFRKPYSLLNQNGRPGGFNPNQDIREHQVLIGSTKRYQDTQHHQISTIINT